MPRRQTVLIQFDDFPPAYIPIDLDDKDQAHDDIFNYLLREGLEKEENRCEYSIKKGGSNQEIDKPIKAYVATYSFFRYAK